MCKFVLLLVSPFIDNATIMLLERALPQQYDSMRNFRYSLRNQSKYFAVKRPAVKAVSKTVFDGKLWLSNRWYKNNLLISSILQVSLQNYWDMQVHKYAYHQTKLITKKIFHKV